MKYLIILSVYISFSVYGQYACERYEKGIEYIKQDFINKGTESIIKIF